MHSLSTSFSRRTAERRSESSDFYELTTAAFIASLYSCEILRMMFDANFGSLAPIYRELSLALYAVTLVLLARQGKAALATILIAPELMGLLLLPVLSTLWSMSPSDTSVRAVALIGSSMFGYYLVARFSPIEILRIVVFASLATAALSLFLIFALPSYGLSTDPAWLGAWRGAYLHKNGMGAWASAGSALATLLLMLETGRRPRWQIAALVLNLFLLLGSRSVSSLITYVASVMAVIGLRMLFGTLKSVAVRFLLCLAPLVIALVIAVDLDTVASLIETFGRDATLSGRIPLWQSVWGFVEEKFWFGHGYEAFWIQGHVSIDVIERLIHYRPAYSHNGVLELLLSLGLIGLLTFAAIAAVYCRRLIRLLAADRAPVVANVALLWLVVLIVRNTSEAGLLERDQIRWVVFVALYLLLAKASRPAASGRAG